MRRPPARGLFRRARGPGDFEHIGGAAPKKRGPRILNTSRGRGGKRGADPLFSILNAVFKMSKKCIFPRRRGKTPVPRMSKNCAPGDRGRREGELGRY